MSTTLTGPISKVIRPLTGVDAMLDAAYETHRRFRHGPFAEPCPTCHVPAGELCLARRSVHAARRRAYRARLERTELVPLLAAEVR
ncbi:hypothetical protein ACGFYQ_34010 [Streptomyces sp. NPDC048258]|uniref:zinc finger domain-containing protein n=1 Tax=Streptomyces sp. NPDC048258 TaxID=3365527 RepID=UPI0037155C6A